ncbi:MAG TPA: MDR family MFS transporter [Acetobacteraceae bacterium]|nr:MDR family MFS transporter [Acetobacteraceae bacterium]
MNADSVAAATEPPAVKPVSAAELRVVMTGLMLALTLAALDQNIVATALPQIVSDLGGLAHLSWVVTAFLVASTSTAPLYGKLSDMYGRKPAFMVSIVVFLAGSALCGQARGMVGLIGFRAVQGIGAGGLITLAQTTIGDLVTPRERGRYQGLFAAVFAACSVAGPLLGGIITQALSWRWIFYVNIPVGAAALVLIGVGLKQRPPRRAHRIDLAGAALLIGATSCTLLMLSWGGSVYPWASAPVIGPALAAVVLFVLLVRTERRAAEPILPPPLFADRVFVLGTAGIGFAAMALFAAVIFLPLFFQLVMGASPTTAGLLLAPLMGGVIVSSFGGGRLVSATGRYKTITLAGLAAATLSFLVMAWAGQSGGGVWPIEAALVLLGLGIGLTTPNLTTAIQSAVRRADLGAATSATAFFRSLGGALGVALAGAILTMRLHSLLPGGHGGAALLTGGVSRIATLPRAQHDLVVFAYRHALATTFLAGAAITALAFFSVLFLPERQLTGG